mmetsp:Transcript_66809/g.106212  ORF Transcript_66809/g.106212 Transcript_66809/m.106212 type:complete len:203 (-) Transcript_66809:284-892(-)
MNIFLQHKIGYILPFIRLYQPILIAVAGVVAIIIDIHFLFIILFVSIIALKPYILNKHIEKAAIFAWLYNLHIAFGLGSIAVAQKYGINPDIDLWIHTHFDQIIRTEIHSWILRCSLLSWCCFHFLWCWLLDGLWYRMDHWLAFVMLVRQFGEIVDFVLDILQICERQSSDASANVVEYDLLILWIIIVVVHLFEKGIMMLF